VNWAIPADGEARAGADGHDLVLTLHTDLDLRADAGAAHARGSLREGERGYLALSWAGRSAPREAGEAWARIDRTVAHWRDWLGQGSFPDHPWRTHLQRSALVLKGLVYLPTGAMVAAPTTSLPETIGGERNWDYRYAWIRDATFLLWGLYTLGLDTEAEDFFSFLEETCRGPDARLQIMYGIGGERDLEERTLAHLGGYEGSRPVRVGNGAYDQAQHDVWGLLVDSVYLHTKSTDDFPDSQWLLVRQQVEEALRNWREPDRGIWEVRGEPKHFTSSKVLCWVAADRGARLARRRGDTELERRWAGAAEEIKDDVLAHGVDARGVFCQHYETTALDASNLLVPLVRFLPPGDPRVRATVLAIADELTEGDLVLRYRVEETDDGLAGEEGAFTICSFWLVSALAEIGERDRARTLCEKLLSYAGPLQLYAEELDPHTGRHLGNFPQAFSHLALVNAVMHVIRAERHEDPGRFGTVERP
jgi:GH15 family glucan-1,4-alpha-glucosidase